MLFYLSISTIFWTRHETRKKSWEVLHLNKKSYGYEKINVPFQTSNAKSLNIRLIEVKSSKEKQRAASVFLILRSLIITPQKNDCSRKCLYKKIRTLPSRFFSSTKKCIDYRKACRTTVYTNLRLVLQCKHFCCDSSLALHFMIIKEMISLNNAYARSVTMQ